MNQKQITANIDKEVIDFYEACMIKNYKKRPTASELLSVDFI